MKALTIRNVDPRLAKALERETRRRGTSLNQTVLSLLGQALGVNAQGPRSNGLRKLAGTWSSDELRAFEESTAAFERVDEELWS
jgi:plasmid stability protein